MIQVMGLITVVAIAVMMAGEKLFSSERLEGVVSVLFGTAALACIYHQTT